MAGLKKKKKKKIKKTKTYTRAHTCAHRFITRITPFCPKIIFKVHGITCINSACSVMLLRMSSRTVPMIRALKKKKRRKKKKKKRCVWGGGGGGGRTSVISAAILQTATTCHNYRELVVPLLVVLAKMHRESKIDLVKMGMERPLRPQVTV